MRLVIRRHVLAAGLAGLMATLPLGAASEKIDYEALSKIKEQGLQPQNSKVMEISSWLTDVYGPRLTGSPASQKAGEWAVGKMKEWGLQNVALEKWPDQTLFPRGWSNDKFYMAATAPQSFPIPGTPTGWTPGTNGLIRGEVILVSETAEADVRKYAGQLKGKWVLTQAAPDVAAFWTAPATRNTPEELQQMELATPPRTEVGVAAPIPGRLGGPGGGRGQFGASAFNRLDFFRTEGALGTISTTARGHGVYVIGGNRSADPAQTLPGVVIPAEQFGRIARMLEKNLPVTIEADIQNTYYPNPVMFNVVGELRGSDKADEVVMLGAHFDSWHASTGATDNAAGSAAMMEAMRILKESGVRLRRTVRIGLWTGEEQGLIGSAQYVSAHFGSRAVIPPPATPTGESAAQRGAGGRGTLGPLEIKPEHAKLAGYFNIDNGTGAIRGVYLQGNDAVAPIFREWIEPFRSLGMAYLTIRNTGGTDHQSYDRIGLPGFQFIQDDIEYNTYTHHTNLDSYERLQPADMMKNATIAAAFAYLAANRDEMLPRKPLPAPVAGRGGSQ
ncbi:MAG: M20/M25/M40 family metallo-hydrolase [Acidobacteria bacterium]|nr:M20/M25/M40 family metallo-hydrolase [Acidobacteriota bacterium]